MSDKPIPERHLSRYRLAKGQLNILPAPEEDPDELYVGLRFQCDEVIEFVEELGSAEAQVSQLSDERDALSRQVQDLLGNEVMLCEAEIKAERLSAERDEIDAKFYDALQEVGVLTSQRDDHEEDVSRLEADLKAMTEERNRLARMLDDRGVCYE